MRTEDELRAALAVREEQSPSSRAVLDNLGPVAARQRRARLAGMAGATLAVAAAVATPVLLVGPAGTPDPGPVLPAAQGTVVDEHAGDRPDFFFTVEPGAVTGYGITPGWVNAYSQVVIVTPSGGSEPVASLTLYRPGVDTRVIGVHAGPPLSPGDGTPVQVHGSDANFLVGTNSDGAAYSVLGWEYVPEGRAELGTLAGATPLTEQEAVALAEALRFVDPYPIRVPVKLDYVPARYSLDHVSIGTRASYGALVFGEPAQESVGRFDVWVAGVASMAGLFPSSEAWPWQPATIGGQDGRCADLIDGRRCELTYGDLVVNMAVTDLTADELDAVVAGLTLGDLTDPSTWFGITDAVPGV